MTRHSSSFWHLSCLPSIVFFNNHHPLSSLALIFSFGSCITSPFIPPFKLTPCLPWVFLSEKSPTPSFQPHQRARAWEAPCKVQKTTVKDNNWVSYKKEGRKEGGKTQHSKVWVKTLPSNSTGASFVTNSTLQLMLLYIVISYNDSIKSAELTKNMQQKGEDVTLQGWVAHLLPRWK